MRRTKLKIAAVAVSAALSAALPAVTHAATYAIGSMDITGGTYRVWDGSNTLITSGGGWGQSFTSFGPNTNLVGGYIGSGNGPWDPTAIALGTIGNLYAFSLYTAASNLGGYFSPAGTITGGPVPTGTLDGSNGTIRIDLSSLFMEQAGIDFNVGTGKADGITSTFATGAWAPNVHAYTLSWTSAIVLPPLPPGAPAICQPQCTAQFTLMGTATPAPVPVPAGLWLMISGLAGLGAWARKQRV